MSCNKITFRHGIKYSPAKTVTPRLSRHRFENNTVLSPRRVLNHLIYSLLEREWQTNKENVVSKATDTMTKPVKYLCETPETKVRVRGSYYCVQGRELIHQRSVIHSHHHNVTGTRSGSKRVCKCAVHNQLIQSEFNSEDKHDKLWLSISFWQRKQESTDKNVLLQFYSR
jgi:hypothetical protein